MISETMENVVKQTILYSFVLSQPFIFNGEVTMAAQKSFDQHKNRLAISNHSKSSRFLQQKLSTLPEHHKISDFSIVIDRHISKLEGNNKQADGMKMNADAKSVFSREASLKKREQQKIEQLAKEIQPGMQNDKVKKVQLALRHFGYYEGEIDGIYGPMTGQALHIAKEEQHLSIPDHPNSITLKETPEEKNMQPEQTDYEVKTKEEKNNSNTANPEKKEKKQRDKPQAKDDQNPEASQIKAEGFNQTGITAAARSLIGTPYVWGGATPQGFDCSGFVQYVFKSQGMTVPRTVNEVYNFSSPVSSPSVGDVVFFETYQPGPSHMGIYLGNNQFIHAGEARGVEITDLNGSYWKDKYLGAKRIRQ